MSAPTKYTSPERDVVRLARTIERRVAIANARATLLRLDVSCGRLARQASARGA